MNKKVFVQTFGCQMNDRDAENMVGLLRKHDYDHTTVPEEADVILLNTCSIREHASEKASSQIGRYGKMKSQSGRSMVIGVAGCLAQQEGADILKRFPYVDLVFGPDALVRLPKMLEEVEQQNRRKLDLERDIENPLFLHEVLSYPFDEPEKEFLGFKPSAFVNVSKGCDFRCTFCVVPNTRGPERSAQPQEILAEVKYLADKGARQVVLLGQNVNSYGKNFSPAYSFAQLLREIESHIAKDSALQRIRFTTSHPVDLSEDLMRSFAELPRLCPHLHLPVQSGDDVVLRRMKRLYTVQDYRQKIRQLREYVPEISLSTDIIVGFPGESEEQFQRTLDLIREVGYTSIYAFTYSARPHTPALNLDDDVPEKVKSERLARVLALQQELSHEQNKLFVGRKVEVLVEYKNERGSRVGFSGRTRCNRLVHLRTPEGVNAIGNLVQVAIDQALPHCLLGTLIETKDHH